MSLRLALRLAALALVIAALFEPSCNRSSRQVRPIFTVDVSSSVDPDSLAESLAWLQSVDTGPGSAGWVAFADHARSAASLDELRRLPVVDGPLAASSAALSRRRTLLAEALSLARSEIASGLVGRIVLLSDGRAEDSPEQLLQEVSGLARDGVRIDTVPLRSSLPAPVISTLTLGVEPRARMPLPLALTVMSSNTNAIQLTAQEGDSAGGGQRLLLNQTFDLEPGLNRLVTQVRLPTAGLTELTLSIDGQEAWRERLLVGERPSALLLRTNAGGPLTAALSAQGWRVREASPQSLPATPTEGLRELSNYDAVIVSNVEAVRLGTARMELLSDWVIAGGALLFASGDVTFGEEGYSESPLEAILPLRFNVEEERTDVALMIALDKSYSMKGPKIELAKEATKAALGELDDRHRFGVVAFDWEPYEVVPLDSARNRERMLESISRIEASAQTNFYPALESCLRQLSAVEAEVRHVILLSDGKTYPDDYEGLIKRMREAEITVSTVGVGSEADRELLADIARWGNGQTYFVQDAKRVQRILLDEARGKLEETLVEEPVRAVAVGSSRALANVGIENAPALAGHLNLEPRQDSEVVLETDTGKPLLARRNVGLGRTWMFTSDLESRWSADWVRWPGFGALWSQVLHDAAARHPEPALDFRVSRRGTRLTATLSAVDPDGRTRNGLVATLRARAGERVGEAPLRQIGPGRYRGGVDIEPVAGASYAVELVIDGAVQAARSVYFPAPDELRPGLANRSRLERLSSLTGGMVAPSLDQIFESRGDRAESAIALWPWLVGLALLLYVSELALRRSGLLAPVAEALALDPSARPDATSPGSGSGASQAASRQRAAAAS